METTHRLQAGYLHAITRQLLEAAGTPRHIADEVTTILVKANLAGHDSHGVLRVPAYLKAIAEGSLIPGAEPAITKETANILFIDGRQGFGHYTASRGMAWCIERAKQDEVCCATFINTNHIGRLGEFAEAAARAGCIGMVTLGVGGGTRRITAPYGTIAGSLSTNPIAVGIPTGDEIPFILDFATSVVAEGKIQVARSKNLSLPPGYIIDKQGNPTITPADLYDGGFLLPFGGHKGSALSILFTLLGGLSGNFDAANNGYMKGEFMQVFNIEAFLPLEEYQRGVRAFLNNIKVSPRASGVDEVLVPGDFEYKNRQERLATGIEIPDTIYSQLQEWANKLDISLGEDTAETGDIARYQSKPV